VFDHVTIRVSDRQASERFYETVLPTLAIVKTHSDGWYAEWADFSIAQATEEKPPTRGLHIGFVAPAREAADEFWRAGAHAGYRDAGRPGPRPEYGGDYYGAFLLDPDGNSAEAVHHGSLRQGGAIDHLWIRVADVPASKRFYETIAPHAGLRLGTDTPERAQFRGASGSFSVLEGSSATENVHLAFPAPDGARSVEDFHAAALAAGFPDNGAPGERAVYHAGYYSAFVRDPDGHNVEVVDHARG
jgi:catechol 2,3-dioxygenase-like lactoylglutathione lyase family enzyme